MDNKKSKNRDEKNEALPLLTVGDKGGVGVVADFSIENI